MIGQTNISHSKRPQAAFYSWDDSLFLKEHQRGIRGIFVRKMSNESPVNQIDSILKLLITPVTLTPDISLQTQVFNVRDILKVSLNAATQCIDKEANLSWLKTAINETALDGPADDICWQFTKVSLQVLTSLCNQLKSARKKYNEKMRDGKDGDGLSASLSPDILSFQQQKNVQRVLQFIACLGISRNLLPGVGASIQQRSKFGSFIISSDHDELSDFDKYQMLYSTVHALNKCSEHPTLGSLIFAGHLGDILAALCQLSYVPLKEVPESKVTDAVTNVQCQQMSSVLSMRKNACEILNKLMENTNQPRLIRQLFLLHRSPPSNTSKLGSGSRKTMRWLTNVTQKLLSERLIKEKGVQAVIQGILDFDVAIMKSTPNDWAHCDVIARLVASCVTSASNKQAYSKLICPQVLDLLDVKAIYQFVRVASLTIMTIALAEPKLAQQHLINPVTEPLLMCCNYQAMNDRKPTEDELFACVSKLHNASHVLVGPDPNEKFVEFLCPILTLLIDMFAFSCSGISYVRTLLEDIICFFLKHGDRKVALNYLIEFLFPFEHNLKSLQLSPKLKFIHGSSGGISVEDHSCSESGDLCWLEGDQIKIAAVIHLLSQLQSDDIAADFFLSILKDLTSIILKEDVDLCVDENCYSQSDELLRIELAQVKKQHHIRRSLLIIQTLSALCNHQTLPESILKDKSKIIQFLKVTFERSSKCCDTECNSGEMEEETLTLSMTMLSMVIDGKETPEIKMALKSCLDSLKVLAKKHRSKNIRSLAEELIVTITSHGVVAMSEKPTTKIVGAENLTTQIKEMAKSLGSNGGKDLAKTATSSYQLAWEDLFDSDPPTRGHALLVMSKLVQSENEETVKNRAQLTMALQESLNHEDSYVYLNAVRAFESLASAFPDATLEHLIEQYSNTELPMSSELKMKLGEVLVKVTQTLGEVIPKYRDLLLGAFLSATKHVDDHVRASSLSNLGEVCKLLRYSLGTCIHQIFDCLTKFIKYDSSLQVRRAAAQVFTLMLRGMGKDSLTILANQMKDIYRLLKFVYATDKDDVVRLHVQLALEELDIICRDFLFPKPSMEKKITVSLAI